MKRIISIGLTIAMLMALVPQAFAFDEGKVGEYNTVSLGQFYGAAIKADGSLWMWGMNSDRGLLGNGKEDHDSYTPIKILSNVVSVSLGIGHSAAIKTDNSLWMWGCNIDGELGDGTNIDSSIPIKVMNDVVSVSLGMGHSAAIKEDGSLWLWGQNTYGQLGDGTNVNSSIPIKIMDDVLSVSLGLYHSAAVKKDGTLWLWGHGWCGELGNNNNAKHSYTPIKIMDDIVSVSLGDGYSAAIKTDGSLWMWGANESGVLGNGSSDYSSIPIKVMDNVVSVSLGNLHSSAIKTDGSLWLWGENSSGQLGNGTNVSSSVPIKVMDDVMFASLGHGLVQGYSAAIKTDGTLWLWGDNSFGQFGNGTKKGSTIPTKITDNIMMPSNRAIVDTREEIKVTFNGEQISFDQPPIIENDRTLVPLRAIFETLGATVEWEQTTQTVTSKRDDIIITLQIGSSVMKKNNEEIVLDVPAQITNERTLVPARAVAEGFGCSVDWDGNTRTVIIEE